jgi:hypothetical protein
MKYLKRFNESHNSIYDLNIKVVGGGVGANGGVQTDNLTISVLNLKSKEESEHMFELGTLPDGDLFVYYTQGEENDFTEHFNLVEDERVDNEELSNFLSVSDGSEVGNDIKIDHFQIAIEDFSHNAGLEYGHLVLDIDGSELELEVVQDARGSGLMTYFHYNSDEDEELGEKLGIDLDDEETISYFQQIYKIFNAMNSKT